MFEFENTGSVTFNNRKMNGRFNIQKYIGIEGELWETIGQDIKSIEYARELINIIKATQFSLIIKRIVEEIE